MKKFLFFLFFLLLCFIMTSTAMGAEFKDIGTLYEVWVTDGYPDYVTGVWSTYGDMTNLTIGIIEGENGEYGKNEILSLIENDSSVTFTQQKYSRNYLVSIMDELDEYIKRGLAFSCGGVYETENVVKLTLLKDKAEDEISEGIKTEMIEKYGDAIVFDYGDAVELTEEILYTIEIGAVKDMIESVNPYVSYSDTENNSQKTNKIFYVILILSLTLVLGMPAFLIKRNRQIRASNGDVISETPLSDKEIEKLLKDADVQFPNELDTKIVNEINKKQ